MMQLPLAPAKLLIPPARPNGMVRPRLTERLNEGLRRRLTLISAPAGYGKTALASEWLSACARPSAWLSLDEGDNDPNRFLYGLIEALGTIRDDLARGLPEWLQAPEPPPAESALNELLREIGKISEPFLLVLDDFHAIRSEAVLHMTAYLLEHSPPKMHLVLLTREEPRLPLARLRVQDQMTELDATDLRFDRNEAVEFLNGVMNVGLSMEAAAELESRTEGWIAALQLAAVSLRGRPDADSFIRTFAGHHRVLLDYLTEEVLNKQPESVRQFILHTSILDRLCGSLCEAVLPEAPAGSGQRVLRDLERANLFVIPLDDERRWYRYHHLFAELLRKRLRHPPASDAMPEPADEAELHVRASAWYEKNGMEAEAFRHAVAANDIGRAARLAEGRELPLHLRGEAAPVLRWLESLPASERDARPALQVLHASALLLAGRPAEVEPVLQAAEAAAREEARGSKAEDKRAGLGNLTGLVAATRATLAAIGMAGSGFSPERKLLDAERQLQQSDADDITGELVGQIAPAQAGAVRDRRQAAAVIVQARRALEQLHPDALPIRLAMFWLLGVAYQSRGERTEAAGAYEEALALSRRMGNSLMTVTAIVGQGQLFEADGRLLEAEERYRSALGLTGDLPLPVLSEAHIGLARIAYEWNDLEPAEEHARKSLDLAISMNDYDRIVTGEIMMARLMLATGEAEGASERLDAVLRFVRRHGLPHRTPEVAAAQAQAALRGGHPAEALRLARMHELPLELARALLASGDAPAALAALESCGLRAEVGTRADERLRAIILRAMAADATGEKAETVPLLIEALERAEPGGYLRIFLDEGPLLVPLLSEAAIRGTLPGYVAKLMASRESERKGNSRPSAAVSGSGSLHAAASGLMVEPLTPRELEVLRLSAQGLSNREIGERLFLALDTVKGHNRRIYGKLQVKRRTEAIALARKLGFIE